MGADTANRHMRLPGVPAADGMPPALPNQQERASLRPVDRNLPHFTVRVSPRAKQARLTCSVGQGLVVVLPQGCDPDLAPVLVARHRAWAERSLHRLGALRRAAQEPPAQLALKAVGVLVTVDYVRRPGQPLRLADSGPDQLLVSGDPAHPDYLPGLRKLLLTWLRYRATRHMPALVREVEQRCGLCCTAVRFRAQRARWGSCTAGGVLHLNAKLLFLPRELAGFVVLHELCHTVHLDHSPRFKALLLSHEPDMERLDAALKTAMAHVPPLLA